MAETAGAPTHDDIALCAYLIYEREDRETGHELEHWHQAEFQLCGMLAHEEVHKDELLNSPPGWEQ